MTTHRHSLLPFAIIALVLGLMLTLQSAWSQAGTPQVRIIDIDDTITPAMSSYVSRTMRSAEKDNVAAIVLRINTPGGLSTAMDDIVNDILQSSVPVIAWVGPANARAASAGVYITYAAHIAAMAPGTNIGSASPIQIGNDTQTGETTAERKAMNDAVTRIENLAKLRDHNVDWAVSAVRDANNITADKALELGVVNLLAPDIPSLLRQVDGMKVELANGDTVTLQTANATTTTASMNLIEDILQLISDPTIAYLLLSIGGLGIFLELSNPGQFLPGIIGVLCFILGLYALGTLPVNWTGVLLIGLGFGLFFLDLFITSFGLLLAGGLTAFIIGSYMLVDDTVPGYGTVSRPVIWTSAALILATALLIGSLVLRTLRSQPRTGKTTLIGQVGVVRKTLAPTGMIFLEGELWTAIAEGLEPGKTLPPGTFVEVLGVQGLQLTVHATDRRPAADVIAASHTVIPST